MRLLFCLVMLSMTISISNADILHVKQAKLAGAAFRCSVFATMLGNGDEMKRLFAIGWREGMNFLDATNGNHALQTEMYKQLPISMIPQNSMHGRDFDLGRFYEKTTAKITNPLSNLPIGGDADAWLDESEKTLRAFAKMQSENENCSLLQ
ncbi:hypothetical protein [Phyllobacterium sp. SB3]|uniref:hypothetical protein n=1 Tax=Phyllobacterium sp. SB3 TaxID=3156073 RepID=UPI0032AFCD4E